MRVLEQLRIAARRLRQFPMAVTCAAVFAAAGASASGLDQLHAFLEGTKSAQGSFRQNVVNKDRRTTQSTSGAFAFQRPGKFRWTYDKPFDQLIVGDGERVWVYDRDLNLRATMPWKRTSRSLRAVRATDWSTSMRRRRPRNRNSPAFASALRTTFRGGCN
jgi:outer membrane lipoprotein-sorting protein